MEPPPSPKPALDARTLVEGARHAVVRVTSAGVRRGAAGTGWIALANGLVVTTHCAVGHDEDVVVALEGGREVDARVLWVDVARDLAMVLPSVPLGVAPLRPALSGWVDPGSGLLAFVRSPEGLRVTPGIVAAKGTATECAWLESDAVRDACGTVVLAWDGQVLGLAVRPPEAGRNRHAEGPDRRSPRVLLSDGVQSTLSAFDRPAVQLIDRVPTYRCPTCGERYGVDDDRCVGCGALLPHAYELGPPLSAIERTVRDALASLGLSANRAREGLRTWRVLRPGPPVGGAGRDGAPPVEVTLHLEPEGRSLVAVAPVVRMAEEDHEPFYRLLLTLNDQTSGRHRLAILGDLVVVQLVEPVSLLREREVAGALQETARLATHFRKALGDGFGAEIAPVLPPDALD